MFRYIKQLSNELTKQSIQKTLIDKLLMRILGLEKVFESDNIIELFADYE